MNNYNYHSNIFFLVNNYYIFVLNPQNTLKYLFYFANDNYYLKIKNKENQPLNIFFKIITNNNKCFYYNIYKKKENLIKLKNFNEINYNNNHKDKIFIDDLILNSVDKFYPNLEIKSYNENLFNLDLSINNTFFLKYNWLYFGRNNKYQYFKYIIYKNKTLFNDILQKSNLNLTYDENKKKTLLFIDDRYDNIFEYILITFLYSINNEWNFILYTSYKNLNKYKESLNLLNIQCKIIVINEFNGIESYSNLLKSYNFWNSFNEEYVLLFQYDSLAFSTFNNEFLKYNYIGAQWPKNIQQIKGIYNGNGGTSLRNVNIMKMITKKYDYKINDLSTPEDKYFSKYLFEEKILMNDPNICDKFSFENKLCQHSIYGHAIYESIKLDNLENYIYNRIQKLLFI